MAVLAGAGEAIGELVERARQGDPHAREQVLARLWPMAVAAAARQAGRHLTPGQDDEASVALIALNEAIDAYRPDHGRAFLGFALQVVRRRVVDHLRRAARRRELPLSQLVAAEGEPHPAAVAFDRAAQAAHRRQEEDGARREELLRFARELRAYGLDLATLVQVTPRHADARENALRVAVAVAQDPGLRAYLRAHRRLPVAMLAQRLGVSRRTLERRGSYILALALAGCGPYPHLRRYLRPGPPEQVPPL